MDDVLQLIREAGTQGIETSTIAVELSLSSRAVRYHVDRLVELGLVVRPTPRGLVYAAGQRPRKRTAAPKSKPRTASRKPPVAEGPTSAEKSAMGATVFGSVLLSLAKVTLIEIGIPHSAWVRQLLAGKASRWPATEAFLHQSAAGHSPEVGERIEIQIRAVGRFYAAARAEMHDVEFRDMLSVLADEKLISLREQAQREDPPDELSVHLADDELRQRQEQRRAAQERAARRQPQRGGPPAQRPRPEVVKTAPLQTNGGTTIVLGTDPFTGRQLQLDVLTTAAVSQADTRRRARDYAAGRYIGAEYRPSPWSAHPGPAGPQIHARQVEMEHARLEADRQQMEQAEATRQAKDADVRRRTGGIFHVDQDGRVRWVQKVQES
jgi:hypothetical protein